MLFANVASDIWLYHPTVSIWLYHRTVGAISIDADVV